MSPTQPKPEIGMHACNICGLPAGAGDAHEDRNVVPTWMVDLSSGPARRQLLHGRPWQWIHNHCAPRWGYVVQTITGITVVDELAERAFRKSGIANPAAWSRHKEATRKPFDYLPADDVDKLTKAVTLELAKLTGIRCSEGACGMCGIAVATGWFQGPLKWSDDTRAPLCVDCADEWITAGSPTDPHQLRRVGLTRFTGIPRMMGRDNVYGLRLYAEIAGDEHTGTTGPWQYRTEQLNEVRRRALRANPRYATAEAREMWERVDRIRRQRAATAAQDPVETGIDWAE